MMQPGQAQEQCLSNRFHPCCIFSGSYKWLLLDVKQANQSHSLLCLTGCMHILRLRCCPCSAFASYAVGLATTIAVMNYFSAAQPALLYIVPAVLGGTGLHALVKREFNLVSQLAAALASVDDWLLRKTEQMCFACMCCFRSCIRSAQLHVAQTQLRVCTYLHKVQIRAKGCNRWACLHTKQSKQTWLATQLLGVLQLYNHAEDQPKEKEAESEGQSGSADSELVTQPKKAL